MEKKKNLFVNIYDFIIDLKDKGAFYIFIGDFITKFITLFGSIFLIRVLSKEEYGLLTYIENLYGYIYMFAGLGMLNSVLRYLIISRDTGKQKSYFTHIVKRSFIINILLIIFSITFFIFYKHKIEFVNAKYLLLLYILILPFQYFYDTILVTVRAKFLIRKYAVLVVISSTLIISFKFIGAFFRGLKGMVIFSLLSYIIIAVFLIYMIRVLFKDHHETIDIKKEEKKEINKYSIQFLLTNSIFTLFMLNDIFMIGLFVNSPELIADYRVAFTLPANLSLISTSIAVFITPYFVMNEKNYDWIKNMFLKLILFLILVIGSAAVILFIFAEEFVIIIFGNEYIDSVNIMRLLIISSSINSIFRYTTANLLNSLGHVKTTLLVSIIGLILQIIFGLILIPKYNVIGAAIVSIIVYIIMSTILLAFIIKKYIIKKNRKEIY